MSEKRSVTPTDCVEAWLEPFPAFSRVVTNLLERWPEHRGYVEARFRNFDAAFEGRMEQLAELALIDIGDALDTYCDDYRWMCEAFLEEEVHFRRHGEYRLSSFADAYAEVYSRPEIMGRYVRGILISQLVWEPHARAFDFFRTEFLAGAAEGDHYLEVGPGHGLFLYFASQTSAIAALEAWDVSESSIAETRQALGKLGVTRLIEIFNQDVLKAPSRHDEFDMAVISEVLEHLENPDLALQSLYAALRPGGRIFINAPVNSPAPDHIYLWRSTEEFIDFVKAQGFEIERTEYFPVTGTSLDRAKRKALSISCVVIGRKPAKSSPAIRSQ